MDAVRVVVTSAGTASAVSLIKALRNQSEIPVEILAVDCDPDATGLRMADRHGLLPRASDPGYSQRLLDACQTFQAQILFPVYSKEIEVVSSMMGQLSQQGVRTMLAAPQTIRIANDKPRMSQIVSDLGIRTPKAYDSSGPWPGVPVIGKRTLSSGSDGLVFIDTEKDWAFYTGKFPDLLYQERVRGQEYTVDLLCDFDHKCLVCSPRSRLQVKAGQSVRGKTERNERVEGAAREICHRLEMVGPGNIQFFVEEGEPCFIELNPRFPAGGLMLTVHAGANIPLMIIRRLLGQEVAPVRTRAGVLMVRYWEEMFSGGE
jgi:carbamoyl-phosphate synthase large subunit